LHAAPRGWRRSRTCSSGPDPPPLRCDVRKREARPINPWNQGGEVQMGFLQRSTTIALALAGGMIVGVVRDAAAPPDTTIPNLSGFGDPLQAIEIELAFGVTTRFAQFAEGQLDFAEIENLPTLGPIFNGRACGGCHFQPALGGSGGSINEVRIRN